MVFRVEKSLAVVFVCCLASFFFLSLVYFQQPQGENVNRCLSALPLGRGLHVELGGRWVGTQHLAVAMETAVEEVEVNLITSEGDTGVEIITAIPPPTTAARGIPCVRP